MRTSLFLIGGLLVLGSVSCGAGEAVRPKDQTYNSATGTDPSAAAICHDVKADGTPLIVDWPGENRGDLEVAMKTGVAFVHYDCNGIKLLPDCTADGKYGFVGITRKEQVISLANADEAKANLPFSGGTVGGSIQTGSTLDIGLIMIGKRSTTMSDVDEKDMKGKCDGATHFVRSATIGAFAMQTDTKGSVQAAGQMFGVGASGASASQKQAMNKDGDATACGNADPDAPKPPGQCGALLRVQLVSIAGDTSAFAATKLSCPDGMVAQNGKCTVNADELTKKCAAGDVASCEASCKANVVESCTTWSDQLIASADHGVARTNDPKIAEAFQRGCDLKNEEMCAMSATCYASGRGVAKDGAKAQTLAVGACKAGAAVGCTILGFMYEKGMGVPADQALAAKLLERACNAGDGIGCMGAAQAYMDGKGVTKDQAKMADYFDRACDAGEAWGCVNAGKSYEQGLGVTANATVAQSFYRRGCEKKNADACTGEKRLKSGH